MLSNKTVSDRNLRIIQAIIAIVFCCIPLFITFPYKINLYLAWEGAYRISEGQIPFRDFGMPLGYGFWLIPALFFKIFGPYMSSLIKAQVLINLISVIAIDRIWKTLDVSQAIRTIGTFVFCLTYVFIHFWPWYNHTVYVYEWVSIAFLLASFKAVGYKRIAWAGLAGIFGFLSVFTKQDIGTLGIFLSLALIGGDFYLRRDYRPALIYIASLFLFGFLLIWPLTNYDFGYWYNYGQEPHSTRISGMDYLDELFGDYGFIYRLYALVVILGIVYLFKMRISGEKAYQYTMLTLLTLGIGVQSLLSGVTSYVPLNAHFFFHAFVFVYGLSVLGLTGLKFDRKLSFVAVIVLTGFIWSQDIWRYSQRILSRYLPPVSASDEGVNRHNYIIRPDVGKTDRSDWVLTGLKTLDNVRMPSETVEGIHWLIGEFGNQEGLRMLNMSELPQLYHELDIDVPKGPDFPMWFHQNVSFFEREEEHFCKMIRNEEFDIILFEVIPNLNRFYPPGVKDCLEQNYTLERTFKAPRIPEISTIEVYVRNQ